MLGVKPSVWQRIGRVASWAKGVWNSISESLLGGVGLRVSLVVVFDELDKLDWNDEIQEHKNPKNNEPKDLKTSPNVVELGTQTLELLTGARDKMLRGGNEILRSTHGIARALKPILTNGQVTFVFVGGTETAFRWRLERGLRDAILPSIFTDHVHIGLLKEADVNALLRINVDGWDDKWDSKNPEEVKAFIVFGLLYQSSGILKSLLLELRSLATRNEQMRGELSTSILMPIIDDFIFCENAKKAFAIEYVLSEYQSSLNSQPIAKKTPFQKDPSLLDDVKRNYYELVQGHLDEDSIRAEFEKLIRKEYVSERRLLDNIAIALAEFPNTPPTDKEPLKIYKSIESAVLKKWPSYAATER